MDLKLGRRPNKTCAIDASAEHIRRRCVKTALQTRFGYRVCGMQVWDSTKATFRRFDKAYGVRLTPDAMTQGEAFKTFWGARGNCSARVQVIEHFLPPLRALLEWFKTQTWFCFRGTSILMVYEGDITQPVAATVRLIDFAHVAFGLAKRDTQCMEGLQNIVSTTEKILRAFQ